jgi:hypothetical protein
MLNQVEHNLLILSQSDEQPHSQFLLQKVRLSHQRLINDILYVDEHIEKTNLFFVQLVISQYENLFILLFNMFSNDRLNNFFTHQVEYSLPLLSSMFLAKHLPLFREVHTGEAILR